MQGALCEEAKAVNSIPCDQRAAGTVNGSLGGTSGWIDTEGFDRAEVQLQLGAADDTLTQIDCQVFENEGVSGNGDQIDGAEIVTLTGTLNDNAIALIDIRLGGRAAGTRKRYIRPRVIMGPSGNCDYGVVVRLYGARSQPVSQAITPVLV